MFQKWSLPCECEIRKEMLTFIAPFVAIALSDIDVKKVQHPQNATNRRPSPMPAIPTIL